MVFSMEVVFGRRVPRFIKRLAAWPEIVGAGYFADNSGFLLSSMYSVVVTHKLWAGC
jgi:hypothetical protein